MTHGDGGKGSGRRKEDVKKIHDNWDLIFGRKSAGKKKTQEKPKMEFNEDGDTICPQCGTEMSATEHGQWLHCDVCGHTEDFIEDDCYDND